MNQNNVWQEYLKAVPELQAPFEAQCRENWVDGTDGPYVILGDGAYALHSGTAGL